MRALGGGGNDVVITHAFCTPTLDGGEWTASRPGRFTPMGRTPGTYWLGGWVGPRAVLDAVVKRKIPSPRRESNPRTPIVRHSSFYSGLMLCWKVHHPDSKSTCPVNDLMFINKYAAVNDIKLEGRSHDWLFRYRRLEWITPLLPDK
jgi:hypothetical protein